jgi:NTE family protein
MTRALVLGGGGVTGVAWELGVLEGLRRAGVDLSDADVVLGTSAGSVVATRLTTGTIEAAYADQLRPPDDEIAARIGPTTMIRLGLLMARRGDPAATYRRIGKAALAHRSVPPEERKDVIRARIGDPEWPDRDLRITAVDVDRGEFVVLDRTSGVRLLDAVAASCAVPLVWPPVEIDGTTYVDGGMRSPANADLVTGAEALVVLAPQVLVFGKEHALDAQVARAGAARSFSLTADDQANQAMGRNSLDPAHRRAAAETGLRQGAEAAEQVAAVWSPAG